MSPLAHAHREGHRPPVDCPVCGDLLHTTRLGCRLCGTELVGEFSRCMFCSLGDDELDLLTVFLASRGNLREVEKHLGVSYPTARLRLTALLTRLGLAESGGDEPRLTREQVLTEVASGVLTPEEGARLIASLD